LSKGSRVTLIKHPLQFAHIFCPSSLSLQVLQTILRSFNGISYEVGLAKSSNFTW
jgi:hypothetical protein